MQKSEVENQQNEESEDVIYKPVDKKVKRNGDANQDSQRDTRINLGFGLSEKKYFSIMIVY